MQYSLKKYVCFNDRRVLQYIVLMFSKRKKHFNYEFAIIKSREYVMYMWRPGERRWSGMPSMRARRLRVRFSLLSRSTSRRLYSSRRVRTRWLTRSRYFEMSFDYTHAHTDNDTQYSRMEDHLTFESNCMFSSDELIVCIARERKRKIRVRQWDWPSRELSWTRCPIRARPSLDGGTSHNEDRVALKRKHIMDMDISNWCTVHTIHF